MGKLITSNRKLGVRSRMLSSDEDGTDCCCSRCCISVPPTSQCQYISQPNPTDPSNLRNEYRQAEFGSCGVTCISFRRKIRGHARVTQTLRWLKSGSGFGQTWDIAYGLRAYGTACYDRLGFQRPLSADVEGAMYYRYSSTTTSINFVRAGQATATTLSTMDLPLLEDEYFDRRTNQRFSWVGTTGGDLELFQTYTFPPFRYGPGQPDEVHGWPSKSAMHMGYRWGPEPILAIPVGIYSSQVPLRTRFGENCLCTRTETRSGDCFFDQPNGPRYTQTESFAITDDGTNGRFTHDFSYQGCGISESKTYVCTWTRIPCECRDDTGPVDITDRPEEREREVVAPDLL